MPGHALQHHPADVIDRQIGKVRVLSHQCATCIFRPGDPMHLGAERTCEVINHNLAAGALLTCHATLPYGDNPEFGPAVCAGFWARHRNDTAAGRLAQFLLGIIRIAPPTTDRQPTQTTRQGKSGEEPSATERNRNRQERSPRDDPAERAHS